MARHGSRESLPCEPSVPVRARSETALDLEDLALDTDFRDLPGLHHAAHSFMGSFRRRFKASRYDTQVLREYLLEQEVRTQDP